MSAPNGFADMWDPRCPFCSGYMHAGHTEDCAVTRARAKANAKLAGSLARVVSSSERPTPSGPAPASEPDTHE